MASKKMSLRSDLKKYIGDNGSVTLEDILLDFDATHSGPPTLEYVTEWDVSNVVAALGRLVDSQQVNATLKTKGGAFEITYSLREHEPVKVDPEQGEKIRSWLSSALYGDGA